MLWRLPTRPAAVTNATAHLVVRMHVIAATAALVSRTCAAHGMARVVRASACAKLCTTRALASSPRGVYGQRISVAQSAEQCDRTVRATRMYAVHGILRTVYVAARA